MIRRESRTFLNILILIGPICLIAQSSNEPLSLRGRIIGAGMSLQSAAIRIDLKGPSTADEIQKLNRYWDLDDRKGFMAAFLEIRLGTLSFIGGAGSRVPLRAAKIIDTESGKKILLISEYRGSIFGSTRTKAVWAGRFLAIVIDIDTEGKGEGTIHEEAIMDFQRDDIVLVSYPSTPKKIINVHPAK